MKLETTQAQLTIDKNQTTISEHQTITNTSLVFNLTQNKIICKQIPNADSPRLHVPCDVFQPTFILQTVQISCRFISVQPTFT